jgi:hypothetical protein
MEYQLKCVCGQTLPVSAGAAGTRLLCSCGRTVEVPSLRELRRQSGEAPTANPVMAIEHLLATQQLPLESTCNSCGREGAEIVKFVAECERRWLRRPGRWDWVVVAIFSLPIALLTHLWIRRTGEVREYGRDVILDLPLRLCPACRPEMRTRSQMAAALRTVPIYAQLLNRYPKAKLSVRPDNPA